MDDKYFFNEEKKRLEPISKICFYCDDIKNNDINTNYYVKLYKVKKRLDLIVYRNVKYSSIEIGLPRCSSCKKSHSKAELYSKIIFVSFLILLVLIGYYYFDDLPKSLLLFIIVFVFLFVFLFFIGEFSFRLFFPFRYIQRGLIKRYKILIANDNIKKDKTIDNFLKDGWSTYEPNA